MGAEGCCHVVCPKHTPPVCLLLYRLLVGIKLGFPSTWLFLYCDSCTYRHLRFRPWSYGANNTMENKVHVVDVDSSLVCKDDLDATTYDNISFTTVVDICSSLYVLVIGMKSYLLCV